MAALFALDAAISGEIIGLVFMRAAGHAWAVLWYASVLLLTGAVGLLVGNWRIYSLPEDSDRSLKFLRAAYLWLLLSLGMLVLLPVHQFIVLPLWAPFRVRVWTGGLPTQGALPRPWAAEWNPCGAKTIANAAESRTVI